MTDRAAIFLDRDGTLIEDTGTLGDPAQVCLFSDTVSALRALQDRFVFFVVTNQSCVARGEISMDDVLRVNAHLAALLENDGIYIERWYICPHERADDCDCIKPNATFLTQAAREFGIDLARSFVIGDHPHDALTGAEEGVRGVYVLTGHGARHLEQLPSGIPVCEGIADAAKWILANTSALCPPFDQI